MTSPLRVHVVAHTHWDREWYHPAGGFRHRLVALVDELLDDPPARGTSFLLDGQAIVLDDYLGIRPERRAELSTLLREDRLEAGPWYVLPDEWLVSGESIIRNIQLGMRLAEELGAPSSRAISPRSVRASASPKRSPVSRKAVSAASRCAVAAA